MRRRLYFLVPDVRRARELFHGLLLARIEDRHIHFLAREGTALGDLPEATLLQKSDAVHGLGVGLITGWVTGAVAGGAVLLVPVTGLDTGLGLVLVTGLIGAIMGVWVSGMIAADIPNTHLAAFMPEIEQGKVLAIIDVPKARVTEVNALVRRHHPRTDVRGRDPTVPAFP